MANFDRARLGAGFHLMTVRDGIVEGAGAYVPWLAPVSVVVTSDRAADAARLRAALAAPPHAPPLRPAKKTG